MQKSFVFVTLPHFWLLDSSNPHVFVAVASLVRISGNSYEKVVPTSIITEPVPPTEPGPPTFVRSIPQSCK